MMTFNQFKGFLAVLLVCLGMQTNAQTFWTADFGDQTASLTNWVHGGTNLSAAPKVWAWTNNPTAGAWTPGAFTAPSAANGYMWFDSDGNAAGAHDVTLTGVGVPANCTGKTDVRLRLFTYYRTFTGSDVARIGISTDGVNFTYRNVPEFDALGDETALGAPQVYQGYLDIDVNEADNQPQVWIQFRWEGDFEYYWKVDDITLAEFQAPTNTTTFRVNMALESVNAAGVFLAGSFNNWSDEPMTNAGNGVWELTKSLTPGTDYEYKFKNGPNGWESAPGLINCGVNNGGNINRALTAATTSVTLPAVCFNSCAPCVLPCNLNPDGIICDNFDTYNPALKLAAQSPTNWSTWSAAPGGTEDGVIVTSPASSAPNSLKVFATATGGGPMDLVLKLQNKTSGHYSLKWKMNIPTNKQGYFNVQGVVPIPAAPIFNGEFYFINGGKGFGISNGDTLVKWTFPYGQWFDFEQRFDLDNNTHSIYVNGNLAGKTAYTGNLGGIDFFGVNNTYEYYVDDLEYIQLPPVVYNVDVCGNAIDLSAYIGQPAGTVNQAGPYDITTATLDPNDPTTGFSCHFGNDPLQGSHWFTFIGDGNTYSITSADCGATPIEDGDTQFALYTGSCGNFTPVACNDDLSGSDLHSNITFPSQAGVTYYLLVDSYNGLDGTYCLDIVQVGNITCAQGAVGTNEISNDGVVCFGGNLNTILTVDPATYSIPNTVPGVRGHLWCITTAPLDPAVWPGTVPGIASTAANTAIGVVALPNDGTGFQPGVYYVTSVVVAGGTLINPAALARVFNIEVANGCFFIGESHQVTLLPEVEDYVILGSVTAATAPGNNGAINITVGGGGAAALGLPYQFMWSNGATTEDISGLAPGTYTVTIVEPTTCVVDGVQTFTVGGFSSAVDPAIISSLVVSPNPTSGLLNLQMSLEQSAEVRVDVVNTLGQIVMTRHLGNTSSINQPIDLTPMSDGTYLMRITLDSETAIRTIVVNK